MVTHDITNLITAVESDPSDKTARLALADAFEEQGNDSAATEQRTLANLTVDERAEVLATFLECPIEDIDGSYWKTQGFDAGSGSYLVLTDDEASQRVREKILYSVWAFNADFIAAYVKLGDWAGNKKVIKVVQDKCSEGCNDLLRAALADEDKFVKDAISADGRGHFLSSYDGEENEVSYNGARLFIYRV